MIRTIRRLCATLAACVATLLLGSCGGVGQDVQRGKEPRFFQGSLGKARLEQILSQGEQDADFAGGEQRERDFMEFGAGLGGEGSGDGSEIHQVGCVGKSRPGET